MATARSAGADDRQWRLPTGRVLDRDLPRPAAGSTTHRHQVAAGLEEEIRDAEIGETRRGPAKGQALPDAAEVDRPSDGDALTTDELDNAFVGSGRASGPVRGSSAEAAAPPSDAPR